ALRTVVADLLSKLEPVEDPDQRGQEEEGDQQGDPRSCDDAGHSAASTSISCSATCSSPATRDPFNMTMSLGLRRSLSTATASVTSATVTVSPFQPAPEEAPSAMISPCSSTVRRSSNSLLVTSRPLRT